MRKKLLKCIKFVLCIMLILSLVVPSYAALQSTDGSVFVTKAEFDSSLADFNSILTTFETSVNSSIDSQVTSYLDKNGIWSPKRQTCLQPEGWTWAFQNYTKTNGNGNVTYDLKDVFKANKTGLCYMQFVYKINKKGTGQNFNYTWGDQWQWTSAVSTSNVFNSIEAWYVIKNGSEQVISFNMIGGTPKVGAVNDNSRVYFAMWTRVASDTEYPTAQMFFVDEGATYSIQLIQYYYMDTTYVTKRNSTYVSEMEVKNLTFDIY